MRTFLTDQAEERISAVAGHLLRYAAVLAITVVLFGTLYFGIKFLE